MSAAQIYQIAIAAGFSPSQAVIMTAIALAESSGNPGAHNPNASTGDNSYGLWQINMIDNLGPARMQQFGISSYDALFDPNTNAKAAFIVSGGGGNFGPWTTYTSGAYKQYLSQAQAAAGGAGAALGAIAGAAPSTQSLGSKLTQVGQVLGGTYDQKNPQGESLGERLQAIMGIVHGDGAV